MQTQFGIIRVGLRFVPHRIIFFQEFLICGNYSERWYLLLVFGLGPVYGVQSELVLCPA